MAIIASGILYLYTVPAKAMSILFVLAGQFYLTINMALLVGKYLAFERMDIENSEKEA